MFLHSLRNVIFVLVPFFLDTNSAVLTRSTELMNLTTHSRIPDGISHISILESLVINEASGRVHHLSHFTVTFSLHHSQQLIRLSLEPNRDILTTKAHTEYLDVQGNVRSSEPVDRLSHKVFKGSAWVQQVDGEYKKVGWARVYVKRDGINPLMEGSFSIMGDHHHIQLRSSFLQTRGESDMYLEDKGVDYMIVYRDSPGVAGKQTGLSCQFKMHGRRTRF
jgi:hypothetical protein